MKMLHCLDSPEMTVLDRQKTRLKWHPEDSFCNAGGLTSFFHGEVVDVPPAMVKHWGQHGSSSSSSFGFEMNLNGAISRTASCPPTVAAAAEMVAKGSPDSASSPENKSFKKRKPDSTLTKQDEDEDTKVKKVKGSNEEMESKITVDESKNNLGSKTKNKKETSATDNSKPSDVQKQDFIHVRARRGQATDSHSLAERVRREKISERMKFLQDLVPGCDKITGKAGMLDEIINYVQSLQRQVEFLSMKLATVNPRLDFEVDDFFAKDMISNDSICFPTIDMTPDMSNPLFHFNPLQPPISSLEMGVTLDMGLRRTTSAPIENFIDSYPQLHPLSAWDNDLLSLYNFELHQERATSFSSQPQFADGVEVGHLKMEI